MQCATQFRSMLGILKSGSGSQTTIEPTSLPRRTDLRPRTLDTGRKIKQQREHQSLNKKTFREPHRNNTCKGKKVQVRAVAVPITSGWTDVLATVEDRAGKHTGVRRRSSKRNATDEPCFQRSSSATKPLVEPEEGK